MITTTTGVSELVASLAGRLGVPVVITIRGSVRTSFYCPVTYYYSTNPVGDEQSERRGGCRLVCLVLQVRTNTFITSCNGRKYKRSLISTSL